MEEIWKPVKKWETLYEVSNLGRVRSKDRVVNRNVNGKIIPTKYTGKILSSHLNKGYEYVTLTSYPRKSPLKVHRLVAEAFIPNPNNLPAVNHKDENKENNCVDNLEWCTSKYNNNYGTKKERLSAKLKHKISQYSLDGNWIRDWDSACDASYALGINRARINGCVLGFKDHKTAGGYIWKSVDDLITKEHIKEASQKTKKSVVQFSLDFVPIKYFDGISDVYNELGYDPSTIVKCCKGKKEKAYGYIWRYASDLAVK